MPETAAGQFGSSSAFEPRALPASRRPASGSLRELGQSLWCHRFFIAAIEGALLFACFLYWLVAPNQYEASARVELRTGSASSLNLEPSEPLAAASILSAPMALETLAGVLRSDQIAWRVITSLKLYQEPGFRGDFAGRFPNFRADSPGPDSQAWLLDRFARRLTVQTVPRTLLVEVRFRCRDAALSASVVNTLLRDYSQQETDSDMQATAQASGWLSGQLVDLKSRVDRDQNRLATFETRHGIVSSPQILDNNQSGETQHSAALVEIDELSRQLVVATSERILTEAEYRAASHGDPEMVIAADPRLQSGNNSFVLSTLQQVRARRSDLELEQAQLSAEHGPSFPRVVEVTRQLQDLDRQKRAEDARLVERFRSNWQTARVREDGIRKSLQQVTADGMRQNQASVEYAVMRQEANASHDLYLRVQDKAEEAGLAAGVRASNVSVIDPARQPVKPVSPNLPLDLAITLFVGLWLTVGAAFLREALARPAARPVMAVLALFVFCLSSNAQAPTPSTSGLPTGVASFPQTEETHSHPNPKDAPEVWPSVPSNGSATPPAIAQSAPPMPAPIAAGDFLEISEYHTPEFHSAVRVSPAGTVTLPMLGNVPVSGKDEQSAADAIDDALRARGMLLHPFVTVIVTAYAGRDVSVLGEVNHPGIYPYTVHHRLLDLISAASGLSANSGRLVNILHADDPKTPHAVTLDPDGADAAVDHNPELSPGDTVQVSRAGLVYVVGDVVRPGGFPVDPVQGLTVVQALSLAWGSSQNASAKALLIREQKDGRTMISLNLHRMLRGQDPDQPVHDRDILFVPDSMAKNLINRTMESAIQSTIGVSIYSALVYSQRY